MKLKEGLALLREEFGNDQIRSRNHDNAKYIPHPHVIRRVNEVCPDNDLEVLNELGPYEKHNKDGEIYYEVVVRVRITGRFEDATIVKEQYGDGNTAGSTWGEAWKAAVSDAFKKAWTLEECGLHLYDKNGFNGVQSQGHAGGSNQGQRSNGAASSNGHSGGQNTDRKATDGQKRMLYAKSCELDEKGFPNAAEVLKQASNTKDLKAHRVDEAKTFYENILTSGVDHGVAEGPPASEPEPVSPSGAATDADAGPPGDLFDEQGNPVPPPIDDEGLPF